MTHLYTDLFIAKFSFWPYLSASQKMDLSGQTQLRQYKKGEILYESKETCLGVALIKTGQLRAYICFAYEMASARLSEMLWTLQQILFLSADKRLVLFLLEESKKKASDRLLLTQEQIASYMGSAREVVSRLLKYFAAEKIVRPERGSVTILDRKKLEQLVG